MMKPSMLLMLSAVASCATLYNRAIGVSDNTAKTAIAQKDYPKLQKLCTGEINTPSANTRDDTCTAAFEIALDKRDVAYMKPLCARRHENFGDRFAGACRNTLKLAIADNDMAAMHELCDRDTFEPACTEVGARETFGDLAHPDCAKLPAQWQKAQHTVFKDASPEQEAPAVVALARCGHGDVIFEKIAHFGSERGDSQGTRILLAADKLDGAALFAAFQAYVKTHGGRGLFGADFQLFGANHTGAWLVESKHLELCDELVTAAAEASNFARHGLIDYYLEANCTAAAPQLAALLTDDAGDTRADACLALGQLGTDEQLPKLRILAETDRTNRVTERPENSGVFVKDYYVADACSKAAGQIALRSGQARQHARR